MEADVNRRRLLLAGAGGLAGLGLLAKAIRSDSGALQPVRRTSLALGTHVTMLALHASLGTAERALSAAFDELERVERSMSLYRPDSDISRLNRAGFLERPHPYLLSVLLRARQISIWSDGAFDVTVQPLWELYAGALEHGSLPDHAAIAATRARVDYRRIEMTPERVRLRPGTAITLNGIAQGFAADRALAAMRAHGIEHALVDAGELGALGHKGPGAPWIAGIRHPRRPDMLLGSGPLDGRCMATSGDYEMSFTADHSCNHIFNPATGRSPRALSSVTVLARSGMDADALSTAAFVLGPEPGVRLLKRWPDADALFVLKDQSVLVTDGFPRITGPRSAT
jgi:thiamine biosynthesis lipoprotein